MLMNAYIPVFDYMVGCNIRQNSSQYSISRIQPRGLHTHCSSAAQAPDLDSATHSGKHSRPQQRYAAAMQLSKHNCTSPQL